MRPDLVEGKILLGDTFAPGWHWGMNLSVEQQTSGGKTTEKQFTGGITHTIIDHVLDFAPLFGLTEESQKVNAYIIAGWEF